MSGSPPGDLWNLRCKFQGRLTIHLAGLKVGSGFDAENYEDKEGDGKDKVGEPGETETTKEDEGKLGKTEDKEDKEEEDCNTARASFSNNGGLELLIGWEKMIEA